MKTVFPVGTTLYQPDRCANGYTLIFRDPIRLVDMNGRLARIWVLDKTINSVGTDRCIS